GNDDDDVEEGYDVTYDVMQPDEQQQDYDDGYDPNAYQQFESQLSPYGTWEDSGTYGHVWVPSPGVVGGDFQPYDTDGYFANTDYGWTWVSNYNWGWAPFHYGRWMVMSGRGWCWMPGTQWGPAWVNWRFGGGYAGWSPMAPRGVSIGAPRGMRGPWRFTTAGQLGVAHPAYLPSRIMPSVWNRTQAVNNVTNVRVGGVGVRINAGPSAAMVAAATGRVVAPVPLRTLAPLALPRATVVAHAGTPMQSRPIGGSFARPASNARWLGASSASHAMPTMGTNYRGYQTQQPAYHMPAQTPYRMGAVQPARYAQPMRYAQPTQQYHYAQPVYRSTYAAPTFHVTTSPSYSAPRAPTYNAPSAPTYSAPAPAPHGGSFSSGGMSGGFHGGGGRGGGHR
ncbi:MAG TPA: DUF6600 domain-containing protein, partial [Polyangia bacterium]|nr:DUF6600 domain-containing protein [Polyangia bacterium]